VAGIITLMPLLIMGGMAVFAFLLSRFFEGGGQMTALVWFLGCGLSLALPTLAVAVATRVFRRITTPLSDVMAAAESVAEGDLSVRVPEPGHAPDEFSRLVRSFNRMTEELELSAQQRRNLTSDVAHELRTPLHIIQGNLEGVLDGVYEPSVDHIEATLDETRLLSRLVDDLQTLSLAEAGQLALKLEPVNVAELLSDVGTSFSGQAEAAGIDLQVKTEQGDEPMVIQADAGRLDQVLNNLISNALRHTPRGGLITLLAEPLEERVRIQVRDNGEGIPAEDLPHVFDRFWRGDRSRSRVVGSGSGLGLAIARQLVGAHHGQITVESQPGEETIFTIELPGRGPV
jgi:signal transduction histidine kinase